MEKITKLEMLKEKRNVKMTTIIMINDNENN